jgi:hypothetical protein
VKEQVDFDVFCAALFDVLGLKKGLKSRSAEMLKAVFLSISGADDVVRLQDFGRVCGLLGPVNAGFLKKLKSVSKVTMCVIFVVFKKQQLRTRGSLAVAALHRPKRFCTHLGTKLFWFASVRRDTISLCRM